MALANYAAYKSEIEEILPGFFAKASITFNGTASEFCTSWGGAPDAGTSPTATARVCNSLTAGSLLPNARTPMNSAWATKYWLAEMELQVAAATSRPGGGIFMLVDRLVDILPSATANATVTPIANLALTGMAPSRFTGGDGVMAALQTLTAIVGAPQLTLTYTNQAGVASRTSKIMLPGTAQVGSIKPFCLQDGDTGIRSVESYNVTTAGTSGQVGLVLYKPIAMFRQPAGPELPGYREMWDGGAITELDPNSCLEIWSISVTASTGSGIFLGRLGIFEG